MPVSLCGWLAARGHEAEHVRFIALRDAKDSEICAEAIRRQAILVTKDRDYVALVDRDQVLQLLLVRTGNKRTAKLLEIMEQQWSDIEFKLLQGQGQVDVG